MECPVCASPSLRRSRRRSLNDYLLSITGVLPWRCNQCQTRFRGRPIPVRFFWYAHCETCGNFDLQRVAPERVPGTTAVFWKALGFAALRCDPCRNNFFTVRPMLLRKKAAGAGTSLA